MLYIKDEKIVSSNQKVLVTDSRQIINPRPEDSIEAGYVEYIPDESGDLIDGEI